MVNSAVIELLEYLRVENVRAIGTYVVEKYRLVFEKFTYVSTFAAIIAKFDLSSETDMMVSWCNCMSVCIAVCFCLCVRMCLSVYPYVSVCISVCVCLYIRMCLWLSVVVSICLSVCMSVCVCGCLYICCNVARPNTFILY